MTNAVVKSDSLHRNLLVDGDIIVSMSRLVWHDENALLWTFIRLVIGSAIRCS